ncbi:short chain dehydrogenase reductase family [Apiospora hydei]|uniref:Short chain dehydrogenase reductase family n=1 Tax=Apiospora hydei TaxID=1337664 RepID=A0ABR1WBL4_9PEZI
MALNGKVVLLTGASMGIGEAIAHSLAAEGARLILISRTKARRLRTCSPTHADDSTGQAGEVDPDPAGLALGAPARFPELSIADIVTMNNTNVNGYMFMTHAVLNQAMLPRDGGVGTILNITSTTALEAPPFPGEAVYHANKALQEAFTNALRNELSGTNIRVLALRPGVVATHFHEQRVGFDKEMYDEFMEGFQPLLSEDVASAAVFMLSQPLNRSIKALDVVPSGVYLLLLFHVSFFKSPVALR